MKTLPKTFSDSHAAVGDELSDATGTPSGAPDVANTPEKEMRKTRAETGTDLFMLRNRYSLISDEESGGEEEVEVVGTSSKAAALLEKFSVRKAPRKRMS
jgi:hypothetical protein